jgi:hypothetical protein
LNLVAVEASDTRHSRDEAVGEARRARLALAQTEQKLQEAVEVRFQFSSREEMLEKR